MNELRQAAETLTSMCADYLRHGITDETFVSNLKTFSEGCTEALKGKGEWSHDLDTILGPPDDLVQECQCTNEGDQCPYCSDAKKEG